MIGQQGYVNFFRIPPDIYILKAFAQSISCLFSIQNIKIFFWTAQQTSTRSLAIISFQNTKSLSDSVDKWSPWSQNEVQNLASVNNMSLYMVVTFASALNEAHVNAMLVAGRPLSVWLRRRAATCCRTPTCFHRRLKSDGAGSVRITASGNPSWECDTVSVNTLQVTFFRKSPSCDSVQSSLVVRCLDGQSRCWKSICAAGWRCPRGRMPSPH